MSEAFPQHEPLIDNPLASVGRQVWHLNSLVARDPLQLEKGYCQSHL